MAKFGRVLITYATRAGSTMEVAVRMGEVLSASGLTVDIVPVETAPDVLTPYRAVILGSAIRFGKLLPEAMAFIQQHQEFLAKKPYNLFVMCTTLAINEDEGCTIVSEYLESARKMAEPARIGLFAGMMDFSKLTFMDRLLMKVLRAEEGDFRNWSQIYTWLEEAALD